MPTILDTYSNYLVDVSMFTVPDFPGLVCIGWVGDDGSFSVWRRGSYAYITRMWRARNFTPGKLKLNF